MTDNRPSLRFKRWSGNDQLRLPAYATDRAAGFDFNAALDEPIVLQPRQRKLVPTGFAVAVPAGYELQIRPRSGLASKHGVTVLNTPGTVDSDYRGQVHVCLINHGAEPFSIAPGDRIAQGILAAAPQWTLIEADHLDDTARGAGGFGSTSV